MATAITPGLPSQAGIGDEGQTSSPIVLRFGPHLFIDGDSNHINEQHQGRLPIPLPRQEAWLALLRARAGAARAAGAEFLFLLAPDKQSVYRHLLPSSYTARPATFLGQDPAVIDMAPALAALAQVTDVYPRTDSHWNHVGALVAALAVQSRRQQTLPDILHIGGRPQTLGISARNSTLSSTLPARSPNSASLRSCCTTTWFRTTAVSASSRGRCHWAPNRGGCSSSATASPTNSLSFSRNFMT
ncbi:alginate O-acetyltransferase AlgX-related protein [Acidisoma sp.]|uniref:alginate O-acetyltransferase AlgX-related protein n=1 Tax=Acidisoma sp. TaxID=1872115 RepID=UPI003B000F90